MNFAEDLLGFLGAFSGLKCNPGSLCRQLKWDLVLLMGPRQHVRESEGEVKLFELCRAFGAEKGSFTTPCQQTSLSWGNVLKNH